ncbi:MAG TPA: right-handed parallel beta-helix repeat-containing protein, partial [Polyangiaceae bacterium]
ERATRHPDQPLVVYPEGAFVVHFGTLYRALAENSATPPDSDPEIWEALPAPADDVRLAADSPHAGLGIR